MLLLRSRFRAIISSKQTRMAEHSIQTSSQERNQASTPLSSFLGSPRFFGGLLSRNFSDDISASPTFIHDARQFCTYNNHPFGYDKKLFNPPRISTSSDNVNKNPCEKTGIGLALEKEDCDAFLKTNSKMVLFGAKLKVQVPTFSTASDLIPLKSPGDFGLKTRNPQLLRSLSVNSACIRGNNDQEEFSLSEMEMSEEYTCVMTYGPNPKTTHIFDDTIVKCCRGIGNLSDLQSDDCLLTNNATNETNFPRGFLGFCYSCQVKLDDGKAIYMYRGEKAFCSHECRSQEMLMEGEQAKNFNSDEDSSFWHEGSHH